jgi:putative two-component system response regulator
MTSGTTIDAIAEFVAPEGSELSPKTVDRLHGHILVVDDDPSGCRVLEAKLRAAGHKVTSSLDPFEGQQLAISESPDMIVSDVCMPGMDGIEFTRWIRDQPATTRVPVLLLTCLDDVEILSRGLDAGANDFLTKPVNSLELQTRIQSLLRTKRLIEDLEVSPTRIASEQVNSDQQPLSWQRSRDRNAKGKSQILLIDDDKSQRRLFQTYMSGLDCEIHAVGTGRMAIQWLDQNTPDVVVSDLLLPDIDGYQIIEQIKNNPRLEHTRVLVISVLSDVNDRAKALNLGADDFVVKGFSRVEFHARIQRLLRLKATMDRLHRQRDEAAMRAVTDSLTGLVTHGYIGEALTQGLSAARRAGESYSLIFADIDHFKAFNDTFGHATGDLVLRGVADTIQQTVRTSDTAGRYGGEEFVMLLPKTDCEEALLVAERIRANIEAKMLVPADGNQNRSIRVTASLGVATFPQDADDMESLLQRADEAMYSVKQQGRNSVVAFGQNVVQDIGERKVLIVDDEERNLRLLKAFLAPAKYDLLTAGDGVEALDVARRSRPDVILLDAMMPRLSGFDVCRRLKSEPGTRLIPIILVTALTGRDDRLRAIEAGADAFISKPIDREELLTQVRAFLRNKQTTDVLEDAETVIFTLARAVEGRDHSTGGHVERVSHYAVELGKAIGLSPSEISGLRDAGIVHDIGKISIPDAVLMKPGTLTTDERKVIQQHVELGYELLRPLRTFKNALPAVRFHHERLDGSGYPLGLRGDEIPLSAQVLAIVDVYDALTTDRVYRPAFTQQKSFEILRDEVQRGLHDSELVEAFISLINS